MKKLFKHLFRILLLLIIVVLVGGFCIDKKLPASWCNGKFDKALEKIVVYGDEGIENYPYQKFSCTTTQATYDEDGKKTIKNETIVKIEKNTKKDGTFTMKVSEITNTYTTSGSQSTTKNSTFEKRDDKFYYALNENELSEMSEIPWSLLLHGNFFSAAPINQVTTKLYFEDDLKENIVKYTQKGIYLSIHSQKDKKEFVLTKVLGTDKLSSYKITSFYYSNNVLKQTTELNYSFKK